MKKRDFWITVATIVIFLAAGLTIVDQFFPFSALFEKKEFMDHVTENHPLSKRALTQLELTDYCASNNLSIPYVREKDDFEMLIFAWRPCTFHMINRIEALGQSNYRIFFPNGEPIKHDFFEKVSVSTNFDPVQDTDDVYKSHRLEVLHFEKEHESDLFKFSREFTFSDAYAYISYARICKANGKKIVRTLGKDDKIKEYSEYYAVNHENSTFTFYIYRLMDANETQTCSSDFIFSPKNPDDFQVLKKIFNHIDFQALGVYEKYRHTLIFDIEKVNQYHFHSRRQNKTLDYSFFKNIDLMNRLNVKFEDKEDYDSVLFGKEVDTPTDYYLHLGQSSRKLREFCFPPIDELARFPWIYEGLNEMEKKEAKDKLNDRPTIEADRE